MSLLEEISRRWKPRVRCYGSWVCYSDYPMKPVAGYGKTCREAYEAWIRAYPDLLPPLGPMRAGR